MSDLRPLPAALQPLGWDRSWSLVLETALQGRPHTVPPPAPARVTRSGPGSCDLLLAGGHGLVHQRATWAPELARAAANDPAESPVTGDWVLVTSESPPDGRTATATIDAVLPRRTVLSRAQVVAGSSRQQVLAANADVVAVVEGMLPAPVPGRLERLLALAWASGAQPVVVLTKSDLVPDPRAIAATVGMLTPGIEVLSTSAVDGEGLTALHGRLAAGSTLALVGASGAGKSTLLNALVAGADHPVMATAGLRSDGKGRHTTVTRELHLAPDGGAVLDTPGMRVIGLSGREDLDEVFAEVPELARGCRFTDCTHRTEPDCAVLAAVRSGALPERRLTSYRKLQREIEHQAARTDARLRAEIAGRQKAIRRAYRRRENGR
ncbi:ribosome small subunit-dependent GTPase A [Actinotalea sp. K2]|uniref:ribosome small subunit-dependent GTPase A n=1 Tax=Actinotalea sp. K2 TaxID=2939438 RepID=UPI00201836F6|nr:ribosome small subunit-dependent GTPase A [Actinotalea sp. K2]MCL3860601.1 ribosome small subunit-dependent GTPase A [Actinotalea sp. K2]